MADPKKISALGAAANILAAEFLVLQGGDNKRAPVSLLDAVYQKLGEAVAPVVTNAVALAATQTLSGSNAQSILDLAPTWNTSGTPTALKVNVTDTASNAASLLADFQVGGASRAKFDKNGALTFGGTYSPSAPTVKTNGAMTFSTTISSNFGFLLTGGGYVLRMDFTGSIPVATLQNNTVLRFSNNNGYNTGDISLQRDADGILAQRNGTAAQTSRIYYSYTDNSNHTRMAFKTASGIHTIETESAGTGEADIDLALTPKGTGRVRFGTHSAIAAETVTGYITIKDAGGTSRKVAVVS